MMGPHDKLGASFLIALNERNSPSKDFDLDRGNRINGMVFCFSFRQLSVLINALFILCLASFCICDEQILRAVNTAEIAMDINAVRIACVGDSITVGEGSGDNDWLSYPARLQVLLKNFPSKKYVVQKFAVSGATVLKESPLSIWKRKQLQNAVDFHPHIVITLFGTNDAKLENFSAETYLEDYTALVKMFIDGSTTATALPHFIIGVPPPIIDSENVIPGITEQSKKSYGIRKELVSTYPDLLEGFVRTQMAKSKASSSSASFSLLNFYSLMMSNAVQYLHKTKLDLEVDSHTKSSKENVHSASRCGDGVHPCTAGYNFMADLVARAIVEESNLGSQVDHTIPLGQFDDHDFRDIDKNIEKAKPEGYDEDIPNTLYDAVHTEGGVVDKVLAVWMWACAYPVGGIGLLIALALCSQMGWQAWFCGLAIRCCIGPAFPNQPREGDASSASNSDHLRRNVPAAVGDCVNTGGIPFQPMSMGTSNSMSRASV